MNNCNLFNLLKDYIISHTLLDNFINIDSIHSNLQSAHKNDLVFYNIREGKKAEGVFEERYNKSQKPILVVNKITNQIKNANNIIKIKRERFLEVQKKLLDCVYPNNKTLKLVGITGTNGKTSVVSLCMQMANQAGLGAAALGTLGLQDISGNIKELEGITTPSYIDLRKIIYELQKKYQVLFLEVSSHALKQDRLYDLKLDIAGWTNFTQDHLDYHLSMEDYFNSKKLIMEKYLKNQGKCFILQSEKELIDKTSKCNICKSLEQLWQKKIPNQFQFSFNRKNLELALNIIMETVGNLQGVDLQKLELAKGRFSQILFGNNKIIIDYAHTPDAIENICRAVKDEFQNKKIIVIFGCGGDRDRSKRPLMAKKVTQYANKTIITNDNPRFEDEKRIIDDILKGIKNNDNVEIIADRKLAIEKGISELEEDSILIIAGKGHEEYQELKGVKHPFSDFDVVNKLIGING